LNTPQGEAVSSGHDPHRLQHKLSPSLSKPGKTHNPIL
jgi:hypothetical protein